MGSKVEFDAFKKLSQKASGEMRFRATFSILGSRVVPLPLLLNSPMPFPSSTNQPRLMQCDAGYNLIGLDLRSTVGGARIAPFDCSFRETVSFSTYAARLG